MTEKKVATPHVIDAVIDHFTAGRRSMVVSEWGDIEIFFTPISYEDLQAIDERNPKSNFERSIFTLVLKAVDANGKQIFRWGDVGHLMKQADMIVVQRCVGFMMSVGKADLTEESAGN